MNKTVLLALAFLCASSLATAKDQDLEQAANDPTASIMAIQFADWHTNDFYNINGDDNQIIFRAAYPFKIGEQKNIARITMPFITDSPLLDNGLSDTTLFNLMVFDQPWGRYGIGAVAVLPTGGEKRGGNQWAVGPAFGFMVRQPKILMGLFNQNAFYITGENSQNKIQVSSFQPIVNYKLGSGWSVGTSEMQISYDWNKNHWSSLPLGLGISKLQRFGKLPVQFSMQYEHNFADNQLSSPKNVMRFVVKILLPK